MKGKAAKVTGITSAYHRYIRFALIKVDIAPYLLTNALWRLIWHYK